MSTAYFEKIAFGEAITTEGPLKVVARTARDFSGFVVAWAKLTVEVAPKVPYGTDTIGVVRADFELSIGKSSDFVSINLVRATHEDGRGTVSLCVAGEPDATGHAPGSLIAPREPVVLKCEAKDDLVGITQLSIVVLPVDGVTQVRT